MWLQVVEEGQLALEKAQVISGSNVTLHSSLRDLHRQ